MTRRSSNALWLVPFVFLFGLASSARAQSGPVSYTVSLDKRPTSHFVNVAMKINSGGGQFIDVAMPAWSPGAYAIQNAWRNVQDFSAADETGSSLRFEKIDKQTWRI